MKAAVIGLGFGDEGKGLVTNWLSLSKNYDIVNRYSGGHQAGHTVWKSSTSHVFQNYGAGTLQGLPTYWNTLINPQKVLKERIVIKDNFGISPKMYVNKSCPITTPYDVIANIKRSNKDSVGQGIGETHQRERDGYSFNVGDLLYDSVAKIKIKEIKDYYERKFPHYDFDSFEDSLTDYKKFIDLVHINSPENVNVIYESSQGLLLDEKIGFYPYVTWGELGSKNIDVSEVYYVTRAYQTRHGKGPMSYEHDSIVKLPDYETNVENEFQGKFRTGILDIQLLKYAIDKDDFSGNKSLVITCVDQFEDYYVVKNGEDCRIYTEKKKFLKYLSDQLESRINTFYVSESPYSENIYSI